MPTKKKPPTGAKRSGGKSQKAGAGQEQIERNPREPQTDERQVGQYSGQGTPPLRKR
jgi:hypothetical protein